MSKPNSDSVSVRENGALRIRSKRRFPYLGRRSVVYKLEGNELVTDQPIGLIGRRQSSVKIADKAVLHRPNRDTVVETSRIEAFDLHRGPLKSGITLVLFSGRNGSNETKVMQLNRLPKREAEMMYAKLRGITDRPSHRECTAPRQALGDHR